MRKPGIIQGLDQFYEITELHKELHKDQSGEPITKLADENVVKEEVD
jgi:hypothetical protein